MRDAMAVAVVGDDGHDEDPTVSQLEKLFAEMVAKEAALFVPSGVMGNQIALRVLTRPGDSVLVGARSHIVDFEMGASARNASIQFATVDDERGVLSPIEVMERIDAELDHAPVIAAVVIENTHMFAGGVPWSTSEIDELAGAAAGRPIHLDGARLFNASVATGETLASLAARATTVTCALSKGLCAPVGSLFASDADTVSRARIERKRLGGAMRQAGFLAAAGIVALETMIERLADDHQRARRLATVIAERFPESEYDAASCRTNIVAFNHPNARQIVAQLGERGVLGETLAPQRARFVTHRDVSDDMIDHACDVVTSLSLR